MECFVENAHTLYSLDSLGYSAELVISTHSFSYDPLLLHPSNNHFCFLDFFFPPNVWFWDFCEISIHSCTAVKTEWCSIRSDKVHTQTQYVCYKIWSNATREWFIVTLNLIEEDLDLLDRNWISWSGLTNTSSLFFSRGAEIHHSSIPVWLKGPII